MWFWLIVLVLIVVFVVYIASALQPQQRPQDCGGLDLFLGDLSSVASDASHGAAASAEEAKRYGRVYDSNDDGEGQQLLIMFATEYGFGEEVAKRLFDRIIAFNDEEQKKNTDGEKKVASLQPRLVNMRDVMSVFDLAREQLVLNVCSTTGDGVPPNDAREFFEWVTSTSGPAADLLASVNYSTLALGDSSYPYYCRAGRTLHQRFQELGATSIADRVDVDQEDWPAIDRWIANVLSKIPSLSLAVRQDYVTERPDVGQSKTEKHNRAKPYWAKLITKRPLTPALSPEQLAKKNYEEDKEVFHLEFELGEDSELSYTSGDAIGIYPTNNPPEVASCLKALASPSTNTSAAARIKVNVPRGAYEKQQQKAEQNTLEDALRFYYDLKFVRPELLVFLQKALDKLADQKSDPSFAKQQRDELAALLAGGASIKENAVLRKYVQEREVADVLEHFAGPYFAVTKAEVAIPEILSNMRMLQPRYYSIASSPTVDHRRAAVTAAVVRYSTLSKDRTGVCTTFLSDRSDVGTQVPVFISKNHDFRLPADNTRGVVMIGPGTGIAPFRGFIQERILNKATGDNLFYFGCRKRELDYLYKDELEAWEKEGKVKLRTAFSREQQEKVYVQHRLLEDAATIWRMMEENAHFYVCGDAGRMANDVHNALLNIMQSQGGLNEEQARAYMAGLESQKRYQRDVWVT